MAVCGNLVIASLLWVLKKINQNVWIRSCFYAISALCECCYFYSIKIIRVVLTSANTVEHLNLARNLQIASSNHMLNIAAVPTLIISITKVKNEMKTRILSALVYTRGQSEFELNRVALTIFVRKLICDYKKRLAVGF